jgi:hypothetical protein
MVTDDTRFKETCAQIPTTPFRLERFSEFVGYAELTEPNPVVG